MLHEQKSVLVGEKNFFSLGINVFPLKTRVREIIFQKGNGKWNCGNLSKGNCFIRMKKEKQKSLKTFRKKAQKLDQKKLNSILTSCFVYLFLEWKFKFASTKLAGKSLLSGVLNLLLTREKAGKCSLNSKAQMLSEEVSNQVDFAVQIKILGGF